MELPFGESGKRVILSASLSFVRLGAISVSNS
jgi:hypothetical protein